ncbi:glucose-6-phosphate isomerase [Ferrimonas lipolytica]|uniref:Glucose-6-phosphate isomerase n=1 Tax=Ferrimonas lipolytica TaxID=2724191 RepID=A0A6H1UA74_9GAMM|nr:glucose-6-phosphate isomerase [Ferrimonas lipolytica]QIZ75490.1 glucose-6-phosphate isomerase [Ferrimonas lipolytica]
MTTLTQLSTWQQLQQQRTSYDKFSLRASFTADPGRAARMSIKAAQLKLDFSKNLLTDDTLTTLCQLAREAGLEPLRDAMFNGEAINNTEGRAVLHTALRNSQRSHIETETGSNVVPEISATLAKMKQFVADVHQGVLTGYSNKAFTDIIAIGIGGSFLGPKVATEALRPYAQAGIKLHFVANVDGTSLAEKLKRIDPETTLVVMSSKSFSTQETITNTQSARDHFIANGVPIEAIGDHFVAISSNVAAAVEFGMKAENVFPMWDWVGGRYSLWSAIGLPIALAVGFDHFEQLLRGAEAMDKHFCEAPLEQNMPAIMGLLSLWYSNFFGTQSQVLLSYDHYLRGLPAYVQQLDMESNGKSVDKEGNPIEYHTGPVIWGGEGTNGQHAYHQLLHQGTGIIPADFILPLQSHNPIAGHHNMLAANCFGQTQALMQGKTLAEARAELAGQGLAEEELERLARHKVMPGNRPSNTLLMDKLTPFTLGSLIALYEHRTFVQGALWGINSFDQWGVELGKALGNGVLAEIEAKTQPNQLDESTNLLVAALRQGHI